MPSILVAHGAFSSGLGFDINTGKNQPRYTNGSHTPRDPKRIRDTAQRLRKGGVGLVFVNGVERLSEAGTGRAGIDQLTVFAEEFGAHWHTFIPTTLMGTEPGDRLAATQWPSSKQRAARAPFGNAMFLRDPSYVVDVAGWDAFLPTLGDYDGFGEHEARALSLRRLVHKATGQRVQVAITELADRNPSKDPEGVHDVENALQLMAVIRALITSGSQMWADSGITVASNGPRRCSILAGSLNRDLTSMLPDRRTATETVQLFARSLMGPKETINQPIARLIEMLPESPGMTLGEFLASERIVLAASGPTGHQQDRPDERLDYTAFVRDYGSSVDFGKTSEDRMPVGFRTFRTNLAQIEISATR